MKALDFAVLIVRLFLGFVFFSSGLCKLTDGNFGQLIGPPHLISDLAEYGLAGFGKLIAISQVLIGTLILTQRFSLVGLIALVPMNISILGVTLSQEWQGTPYINAFLLLLNICCLLYELPTLKVLFSQKINSLKAPRSILLFPDLKLPVLITGLSLIAIAFAEKGGIKLDVLASLCLFLVCMNLFQFRKYHFSEKIVLAFYTLTVLLVVNFKIVQETVSHSEYLFIGIISLGFLFFLFSIFRRRRSENDNLAGKEVLP